MHPAGRGAGRDPLRPRHPADIECTSREATLKDGQDSAETGPQGEVAYGRRDLNPAVGGGQPSRSNPRSPLRGSPCLEDPKEP
jgi:hypothetical protein